MSTTQTPTPNALGPTTDRTKTPPAARAFAAWGPPFPLPDQTNRAWREQVLTNVAEMKALSIWLTNVGEPDDVLTPAERDAIRRAYNELDRAIDGHLAAALEAAAKPAKWPARRVGADV